MFRFGAVALVGLLTFDVACNDTSGSTAASQNGATSTGGGTSTARNTGGSLAIGGGSTVVGGASSNTTGGAAAAGGNTAMSTGGSLATGGNASSTGGNASSTGGATVQSAGGSVAIGGATSSSGGAALGSTGGASTLAGGAVGTGGALAVTGGASAQGGSAAGTGGTVNPTGGAASAGGSSSTSTCTIPTCLYEMYRPCSPATPPSSCIIQDTTTATTRQTNACYSDGTSASSTTDLATYASTMTFRVGGAVCYTLETSITMSTSGVPLSSLTTYKNSTGAVVATQTWDVSSSVSTVTCTGARPVLWDSSCDNSSSTDANCQPGVCNP